jgi:hypothetical protein
VDHWNTSREYGTRLEQARAITQQMRARGELRPLEWQTRIRDPLGRWPKRAVYKTVHAKIRVPVRGIAQEIPVWATGLAYSSSFIVDVSPVKGVTRSKEQEWLDRQHEAFCARKVGQGGY